MLSAFIAEPIIELKQRDKSKIESILSHGDQLLVGLSTGSLRTYRTINPPSRDENEGEADNQPPVKAKARTTELLREHEKFSKHKIEQLAIFKEANILISLSGGLISLHDLGTFEVQDVLHKAKGAVTFAVTSNIVNDVVSGVPGLVSRLAVAVKRRLLIWSWQDGEPSRENQEIALASSIKSLLWASGTKLVAGLASQYVLVDIDTQDVKMLSGPGSIGGNPETDSSRLGGVGTGTMSYLGMGSMIPNPLVTGLGENEMLLARDINTQFIDRNGEPLQRRQIPWRAAPQAVAYSYPFLLALQEVSKGALEIRNPQTLTLLQSIQLPSANLLQVPNPNISLAHQGKGFLVASDRIVWRMMGLSYDVQIDSLIETTNYDEAVSLLNMVEETLVEDSKGRLREVKMLKAQALFDKKRYREALDIFGEVMAPPERVIRLYPENIAGSLAEAKTAPNSPVKGHRKTTSVASMAKQKGDDNASLTSNQGEQDTISEKDVKQAVRELQAFLADNRRRLQRFFNPDQTMKNIEDLLQGDQAQETRQVLEDLIGVHDIRNTDVASRLAETATLLDTTLFRAYMFATPSLAGPLFRTANFCDPDVVMARLEASERYGDLIDFLYGKKLHRQALKMLQKFGQDKRTDSIDPQLHGPQRTVTYLQSLAPENIELIIEFARWPMEIDSQLAMEIFLADTENADNLPRDKVLAFLEPIHQDLALQYLEHVVDELEDESPELHQKLLTLYFDKISHSSEPDRHELIDKFVTMLKTSTQYSPAKVLGQLPRDDPIFFEATAIVFSKMGQQKQALQVYVFKLRNIEKAEEYCNEVYLQQSMQDESTQQVSSRKSSTITKDPTDEKPSIYHVLLNLYLNPPSTEKALIGPAIDLMAKHGPRLPASSTLEMIPNDLLVKELEFYLRGRMRHANTAMNESKVVAGLQKVNAIRVSAALLLGEDDATLWSDGGRQRKVRVDDDKVCRVCFKRLGGSVVSVFPDNSVVHLGCANRRQNELNAQA